MSAASFFFSSMVALSLSYSAICKCRVNSFAVSRNSSSTIIHSSSRKSNLDAALCMPSTNGCSRSLTGGGDDEPSRFLRSASLALALVRGVDGSAGSPGRSSSDSSDLPVLLARTVSSKKPSSVSVALCDFVVCCDDAGLICARLPPLFFAQGS